MSVWNKVNEYMNDVLGKKKEEMENANLVKMGYGYSLALKVQVKHIS